MWSHESIISHIWDINNPQTGDFLRHSDRVPKHIELKTILASNLSKLMEEHVQLNTVDAVSERSKVGRGTVDRVKKAEVSTSLDTLEKLSEAFDMEPAQLITPGMERRLKKRREGRFEVASFDIAASMGSGLYVPEHEDVVDHITISEEWLRHTVRFSSPQNLALITGYGDSMDPTFRDGDALLVDRGIDSVKIDAVYVLALRDELYIKRLQRRPDGSIQMISDNKKYEPYTIANGEMDQFRVLGRVLLVWNAVKL